VDLDSSLNLFITLAHFDLQLLDIGLEPLYMLLIPPFIFSSLILQMFYKLLLVRLLRLLKVMNLSD